MNMKRIRRTVLFAAFSIILAAISLCSTPLRADEFTKTDEIFDAHKILFSEAQKKVGKPRAITRTPVFNNAPFLQLKPGSKIIKGKKWMDSSKNPKDYHFEEKESYFLLTNNKYYFLGWIRENSDKLFLSYGSYSLLFDWDFSLANATILQQLDEREFGEKISVESFANLKKDLQKEFPESVRDAGKAIVETPYLKGGGKARRAIFQGLGFDRYRNTISKYQLEIGNETYIFKIKKLIVGPQRAGITDKIKPNFDAVPKVKRTPQQVAKERALQERIMKFQAIVNSFLIQPTPLLHGLR